jgi:hypothetical protein
MESTQTVAPPEFYSCKAGGRNWLYFRRSRFLDQHLGDSRQFAALRRLDRNAISCLIGPFGKIASAREIGPERGLNSAGSS